MVKADGTCWLQVSSAARVVQQTPGLNDSASQIKCALHPWKPVQGALNTDSSWGLGLLRRTWYLINIEQSIPYAEREAMIEQYRAIDRSIRGERQ